MAGGGAALNVLHATCSTFTSERFILYKVTELCVVINKETKGSLGMQLWRLRTEAVTELRLRDSTVTQNSKCKKSLELKVQNNNCS